MNDDLAATRRACLVGAGVLALRPGAAMSAAAADVPQLSLADLRRRYARPGSQFLPLAGTSTHVLAEGRGPLVVLVHGHLNSLSLWDGWARDLARDHRVVRFDMPGYGLSDAGDRKPGLETSVAVLDALMEREGAAPALIAGHANGGPVAFWFARHRPERVRGVALVNAPFFPPTYLSAPPASAVASGGAMKTHGLTLAATRPFLEALVKDRARLTDAYVRQVYDLNRRAGPRDVLGLYGTSTVLASDRFNPEGASTADALAAYPQPVLIQWSGTGYLQMQEAERLRAAFVHAPVTLQVIDNAGHWAPLDRPRETVAGLRAFEAGLG